MKPYLKKILILAVILRLLVSGLLFHPDIKTIAFQTSFLKKGIVNIYPYLINNRASLPLKEEFVYFPLTYITLGSYQAIISTVLGNSFDKWLIDAGTNSMVNNPNVISYLIFLKLPLLAADIGIAFLLLKLFKDKNQSELAFTIWLFNPFTIILIYAFSNIDLYAVLLTLIAFLYLKREKLLTTSIFIGLAASIKLYPLLFVPFLFLKAKNLKEKILSIIIPVSIFLLTIIPFWSKDFVNSALLSGLSTRIFGPSFTIGFGESIVMGLFLMTVLFFGSFVFDSKIHLFNYFISLLLIIFSFSHFHISWLLWIAPFLVILIAKKRELFWTVFFWFVFAMTVPLFYSDRSMTISLFRIYTTWFDLLPTPFLVIQKFYDPYIFQSLLHSVLAGISVIIAYKILPNKINKND